MLGSKNQTTSVGRYQSFPWTDEMLLSHRTALMKVAYIKKYLILFDYKCLVVVTFRSNVNYIPTVPVSAFCFWFLFSKQWLWWIFRPLIKTLFPSKALVMLSSVSWGCKGSRGSQWRWMYSSATWGIIMIKAPAKGHARPQCLHGNTSGSFKKLTAESDFKPPGRELLMSEQEEIRIQCFISHSLCVYCSHMFVIQVIAIWSNSFQVVLIEYGPKINVMVRLNN